MADAEKSGSIKRRELLVRVSVVIGSILTALVVAELLTRLVLPQLSPTREGRVKFWVYDELLGWSHQPDTRARFKHPEFDVEVAINSDGMRDTERDASSSRRRKALVLGDSFGWGFGVEHGERFDTLLEGRHDDWDFINASVSGYGTDQQYLWLLNNGLEYAPELILLLLYQNDFSNNTTPEQYWYYKPMFELEEGALKLTNVPVPEASFDQLLSRLIIGRTYLYGYLYRAVVFPINFRIETARREKAREKGVVHKSRSSANELMAALLTAMKQFSDANGIRFVVVSVPAESRYSDYLTEFSTASGIDYLPLEQSRSFATVEQAEYTFRRDWHWNALGHTLAADAIDDYLQQLGVYKSAVE